MGFNGVLIEPHAPIPDAVRQLAREQLERMLANPLFKHSKRYPSLLRYVVEHALENPDFHIKERTLGIEVFGRDPNYDTSLDPVVRTTAGELRKRIAQYYHEPGHELELRIDLPIGSYVPEFRPPISQAAVPVPVVEIPVAPVPAAPEPAPAILIDSRHRRRWWMPRDRSCCTMPTDRS